MPLKQKTGILSMSAFSNIYSKRRIHLNLEDSNKDMKKTYHRYR